MSKVYKQDPKLPQGKWIDENESGPRSFQEVADAMYDNPEATPSPDTPGAVPEAEPAMSPLTRYHHNGHWLVLSEEHEAYAADLRRQLDEVRTWLRVERDALTAAQAELRTMRAKLEEAKKKP